MTDFNIGHLDVDNSSVELIDEQMMEAVDRFAAQKEKILALAYLKGYDGIDITVTTPRIGNVEDFRHGIEWEGWMGEPEPLEPYTSRTQRYDFRNLSDREKMRLTSIVGANPENRDK